MDEHTASAIQYGHLGKAIYLPESRTWAFSRTVEGPSLISYTGITKTTIPSPFSTPQGSSSENKSPLPIAHPDLAACWPSVDEDLSRAVTATSEICDTRVSSLFDIGYALDHDHGDSTSGTIPIAVVASGQCRNCISFRIFEENTVELTQWNDQTSHRLRVPSVGDAESTEWSPGAAPVRQICYARTVEEPPTWVAARFPLSTVVFRPLYHKSRVPMHIDVVDSPEVSPKLRNSRLDANPLIEISSAQTGGFAHADVTFNPWYQKQLGIVDERGNWSIWEMSGRRRRNKGNWTTACVRSGSLPWLDLGGSHGLGDCPRHDGWVAIEFAGDVTSFVVADRRCLVLYRMDSDHVWPYAAELGLSKNSEWILDVKRSHYDASHVFVLTTSRILWLDVAPIIESPDDREKRPLLAPRLSWYHFRDPEDTTLRLTSSLIDEDLYLILYSRLNHCVLAFQSRILLEGQVGMMQAPDPFILEVPPASDDLVVSQVSGPGVRFSTLVFKEIAPRSASTGRRHSDLKHRLMKLFTLDSSLALHESVYVGPPGENVVDEDLLGRELLRLKRRHQSTQKRQLAQSTDDFVVDDWDESVLSTAPRRSFSAVALSEMPEWAIDFKRVYAVATGKPAMIKGDIGQGRGRSFRQSIEDLGHQISRAELSNQNTTSTTLELLGQTPLLDDIDQNARDLQELEATLISRGSMSENEYRLVALPRGLSSSSTAGSARSTDPSAKSDLVDAYDSLVNDWVSSLPHDIPVRTRIMKENAARSVAADLVLSQITVTRGWDGPKQTRHEVQTTDSDMADFLRASEITPSGELEAGSTTQPSRSQTYPGLSSLTTFNEQQQMPQNVATMLSHWQPGTNPASYDWQATVQEQASGSETPRRTSRSRSRMTLSRSPGIGSSTPPATPSALHAVRHWDSQLDSASAPLKLESSQATEEDVPMTQMERGVFGGREAARKSGFKARKKRAAGF